MKKPLIKNSDIMSTDWAARERQAFLRSIKPARTPKNELLAPGLPAGGIWMTDVSVLDRRSVKAQLRGALNWRAAWWSLNRAIHSAVRPQVALDRIMYAFHARHQSVTLAWLKVWYHFNSLHQTIQRHGAFAGLKFVMNDGQAQASRQKRQGAGE